MPSIEENAFLLLDIIVQLPKSEWNTKKLGIGPLGPRSERLVELSGLSKDDLNNALHWLFQRNAIEVIERVDPREQFFYRRVQRITPDGNLMYAQLKEKQAELSFERENVMSENQAERRPDARKVFVVYGRNEKARRALFEFLRSIGLDPKEWTQWVHESGQGSPYVGQVLKHGFEEAKAFVVLFSPDDEAQLREPLRSDHEEPYEVTLTPQPRQNVIYEAGMAMGIDEQRTILVELGRMRPMSDVFGRHVVRINNTPARRNDFAERLRKAGCPVDTRGEDWLTAGDFDAALEGL